MESIEEKTDSDIAEVTASKTDFGVVEAATEPIAALFSVLTAERLMGVLDGAPKKAPPAPEKMAGKSEKQLGMWREQVRAFEAASAFGLALEGAFGDPGEDRLRRDADRAAGARAQLSLLPAERAATRNRACFPGSASMTAAACWPIGSSQEARALAAHDIASFIGRSVSRTCGRTCSRPSPRAASTP